MERDVLEYRRAKVAVCKGARFWVEFNSRVVILNIAIKNAKEASGP